MEKSMYYSDNEVDVCPPHHNEGEHDAVPFSEGFGQASVKTIDFSGIRLIYGKLKFIKPVPVLVQNESPYIEMFFSMTGSRDIFLPASGRRNSVKAGFHNLYYLPDSEFYIEPGADENESLSVQIQFTHDYFKRFIPEEPSLFSDFINTIEGREFSMLNENSLRITPEMYTLLNNMVHCEKAGIMRQLYAETNALKLLLLQFEQCQQTESVKQTQHIKHYDIEKLELVKTLLEENIAYGHSMGELCRKSGLNDFKLKKGFKELFGTTVFGYLHNLRMNKALQMLKEEANTVAAIAECCGYSYVQSFSTAFKQRYGTTPEKFRKQERPPQ